MEKVFIKSKLHPLHLTFLDEINNPNNK